MRTQRTVSAGSLAQPDRSLGRSIWRRASRLAVGLAACTIGVLGTAQAAAAVSWQAPVTVSAAGEQAYLNPRIATDSSGDMVVAWLQVTSFGNCPCKVRAAYRPAGGSFGAPVDISPSIPGSSSPQAILLAVDAHGDAIVAWNGGVDPSNSSLYDTPYAAIRPSSGSWGTPVALDHPSGQNEFGVEINQLVMDSAGDAIAGLTGEQPYTGPGGAAGDQTIDAEVVSRPAGGAFDTAHPQVLTDGAHTGFLRSLAMSPDGKAVLAIRSDVNDESQAPAPEPDSVITMTSSAPGAAFGSAHTLETVTPDSLGGSPSVDTGSSTEPTAAIDDNGDYAVIYDRNDPNGQQFSFNTTPKVSINGGAPTSLMPAGVTNAAANGVLMSPSGQILAVLNNESGTSYESVGTPGGGMGTPSSVALPVPAALANAANEPASNGSILWAFDAAGAQQTDVDASIGSAAGSFPAASTLATNDDNLSFGTGAAIDAAGDAGVVWLGGSSGLEVHVALTSGGGGGGTQHTLTVTRSGSGGVTSSPAGISCGSTCSHAFAAGTQVTLSAHPASGFRFTGWSGSCTGTGQCTVVLSADRSVAATFKPIPPPNTTITKPTISSAHRSATFSFKGSGGVGRLHFQCKLDRSQWKTCTSPATYSRLTRGKHLFEVRAVDSRGKVDATPAEKHFTI